MQKLSILFIAALLGAQALAYPLRSDLPQLTRDTTTCPPSTLQAVKGLYSIATSEIDEISLVPLSDESTENASADDPKKQEVKSTQLPPLFIKARIKSYKKIVIGRRRLSLSSRGATSSAPPTDLIYKTVPVVAEKDINISLLVEKYAAKYNLDPWLVLGVIEIESAFRPNAVSSAGAGGLMQLMPATAAHLGCKDRFNPEQNIAAGTRYLATLFKRFKTEELMLAAYNAGPGNVTRYGGIPPFSETKKYITKVKQAKARAKARVTP